MTNEHPTVVSSGDRKLYVVDDDDEYRRSLVVLLTLAGWNVRDFASAILFLEVAKDLDPGTLLLDVRMPGLGGLELLSQYPEILSRVTVIMITGHGDVDTAVRSLKNGAVDFLEKPFAPEALLKMLEATAGTTAAQTIERESVHRARLTIEQLTPRERDVLSGMLAGGSNKRIARHLNISSRTVEMHRAKLLQKLGQSNSAEAIKIGTLARLSAAW